MPLGGEKIYHEKELWLVTYNVLNKLIKSGVVVEIDQLYKMSFIYLLAVIPFNLIHGFV